MDDFPSPVDIILSSIAFLVGWGYAVYAYGFFLGLGLGWLPAFFIAIIFLFVWRIALLVCVIIVAALFLWAKLS
jgi:hypothetical protein